MSLSFFKNKSSFLTVADFSFLETDLHSHLIPGIDDGSPDIETSLSLIASLHNLGYKKIITTPHIMQERYRNNPEIISQGCLKVQQELKAHDIAVDFRAAAEHLLDPGLLERIERDEPLLTLSGKKLLIEFSFLAPPVQLHHLLYQIQMKGYELVVAHPERYKYFHDKPEKYQELIDMGCELQMNLLSLAGHYGKGIKKAALKLLENQYVSYLGTDLHHQRHIEELHQLLKDYHVMKRLEEYPWKNKSL
jgi:tyrosine-protein phosphatase YwqE